MGKKARGMGLQMERGRQTPFWEQSGGRRRSPDNPQGAPAVEVQPERMELRTPRLQFEVGSLRDGMMRLAMEVMGGGAKAGELPKTGDDHIEAIRGRRSVEGADIHWQFDCFADFVDQAEYRWTSKFANSNMEDSNQTAQGDWGGTSTFADAVVVARSGWSNGLDQVSKLLEDIRVTTDTMTFSEVPGYDVAGPHPNVPMFCGGDPLHFQLPAASIGAYSILELVIPIGASSGVSSTQIINYGASLLAFVDRLEAAGRRVGVTVVNGFERGHKLVVQTRVKRPEDAIALDTLAFALAHPASFRRLGFAMLESCRSESWKQRFAFGYGKPLTIKPSNLKDLEDPVILPSLSDSGKWGNARAAISSMRQILLERVSGLGDDEIHSIIGEAA